MCQSNVYLLRKGQEELILENATAISVEDGSVVLEELFGERRRVAARIRRIDLLKHRVLLEPADGLPEVLGMAKTFHGHLGPNVALGVRMGRIFVDKLGDEPLGERPFSFQITVYTGTTPPISCLMDGLQLSTLCTVGNGGIRIEEGGVLRAAATRDDREVEIRVRPEIVERIRTGFDRSHEEVLPREFWEMPDEALFEVAER